MRKHFLLFLYAPIVLLMSSCQEEVDERPTDEMLRFNAYMQVNHPALYELGPTESGLYHIISGTGQGEPPKEGDYVLFDYSISNLDDQVVETTVRHVAWLHDILSSSTNYVPAFRMYINPLNPLIKGIVEGLSLMRPGDTATLFMPSSLAYGATSFKGFNPYTSIICTLILHRVVPNPQEYENELIAAYLSANYPNISISDTINGGIYVLELEEGKGDKFFEDGSTISVDYAGSLTNGFLFDTSIRSLAVERGILNSQKTYAPLDVVMGQVGAVIEGFMSALRILKPEGRAKVLIPSRKGYGASGTASIAPYAPLVFDITVTTEYSEPEEE